MGTRAERTNPGLWDKVKAQITRGAKGGRAGQWSARKAQMAVQEYKRRGGGYVGGKRTDNSLVEWTEEDWGTRSDRNSTDTGERYLPREARDALTPEQYDRTTRKKRADTRAGRQFSKQPRAIARKVAAHRHKAGDGRSREPARAGRGERAKARK